MTIIVSVKINDGVVMAADSALTFSGGQSYQHANKIVNLRKGLPIGVMSTGFGGIGNESMETLFKDLRRRLSGDDTAFQQWKLDPFAYLIGDVAARVREFLFEEKAQSGAIPVESLIRVCGYSANRPLAETWQVFLSGSSCDTPRAIQSESDFGLLWNGEMEALNRLVLGLGSEFVKHGVDLGFAEPQVIDVQGKLHTKMYAPLVMNVRDNTY
jgi:hypothetical protein